MEKLLVGQGSCNGEGTPVPLSHPFDIQVQGHEPREEWQRGPAPGQTGSHRTGPQSSSPRLAPSHPILPRLAQAYGSQAANPQWTGRSPTLLYTESHLSASAGSETAAASTRERGPAEREGGCSALQLLMYPGLWMRAQRSLLLMITPTSPPGHSASRPLRRSTHPHGNSGRAVHTM